MKTSILAKIIVAICYAVPLYIGISCAVFALRHPELTDTQRFFHIWDALTWR